MRTFVKTGSEPYLMPDPKQDPAETARAGSATLVLTSIKGYNTGPFLDLYGYYFSTKIYIKQVSSKSCVLCSL